MAFPIDQSVDNTSPEHQQLKAGQRVFNGRYELKEKLGAGGMGVVWLAHDLTEKTDVALKFLPTVLVQHEREMDRLREEVRTGKELRHPLIVATYAMEVAGSLAAIVLEYVPGQSLKQKLEASACGFLEPAEVDGWLRDVASALTYLHESKQRLHRDLKPANIIIDRNGRARLMDFGISQSIQETLGRHSQTNQGHGTSNTLAYASPESLRLRHRPAIADDIYGLGATLYDLLTGTPPFYQGSPEVIALHVKTEPVPSMAERRQELVEDGMNATVGEPVPAQWEKAVASCLAKDSKYRPASANAVLTMLEPAPEPEAAKAEAQSKPADAAPPRMAGHRLLGIVMAVISIGVAGYTGWVVDKHNHTAPKKSTAKPLVDDIKKTVPSGQKDPVENLAELDSGGPILLPHELLFVPGSDQLEDSARLSLMKLGFLIQKNPESQFVIEAHCNTEASPEANLRLSQQRAQAVLGWLQTTLKIDTSSGRITAVGLGDTKPLSAQPNDPKNNRVEIKVRPRSQTPKVPATGAAAVTKADPTPPKPEVSKAPPVSPINEGAVGKVISFTLPGGVEMKFCYCPAGEFLMGSPKTEVGRTDDEDQITVQITQGYWLAQTECTQGQWEALMGSNPSNFKGSKNLPVEAVSWEDAQQLITKLNATMSVPAEWTFSLPTEAQWEYACRAGKPGVFAFGDVLTSSQANFDGGHPYGGRSVAKGPNLARTVAVGSYPPNAWGLSDMHGNVWEWCQDAWDGESKLKGGSDPLMNSGSSRVYRGGSWSSVGDVCRSAARFANLPTDRLLGFRVALVPREGPSVPAQPKPAASTAPPVSPIDDGAVGKVISFTLPSGVEMKFCYCPAGKFEMGSPKTEEGRSDDEDQVPVQITRGYWLAQTECTQGQWEVLMGSNPSNFKGSMHVPVEQVSWEDAQQWITKLNEAVRLPTGWTFELPTEAQWEYACRAGSQGTWGNITKDQMGTLEELGWYGENSGDRTHDVMTKSANVWGLYDMHGNVLEWCRDAWNGTSKLIGGPNPESQSGSYRVGRGGSWSGYGRLCRSAYRFGDAPANRYDNLGFRVAAVPTELK